MMTVRSRGRRSRRRGSALVEFVFMLPFYCSCLFGIIEFGYIYYVRIQIDQLCREGVRRAALGKTLSDIRLTMQNSHPTVPKDSEIAIEYNNALEGTGNWVAAADNAGGTGNAIPQGFICRVRVVNFKQRLITAGYFSFVPGVSAGNFVMNGQEFMVRE